MANLNPIKELENQETANSYRQDAASNYAAALLSEHLGLSPDDHYLQMNLNNRRALYFSPSQGTA